MEEDTKCGTGAPATPPEAGGRSPAASDEGESGGPGAGAAAVPEGVPKPTTIHALGTGAGAKRRADLSALPPNLLAVDVYEAAAMLGVCHATIRAEIKRGRLRGFLIGRKVRVRMAELHNYMKRQEAGA